MWIGTLPFGASYLIFLAMKSKKTNGKYVQDLYVLTKEGVKVSLIVLVLMGVALNILLEAGIFWNF